MAPTEFALNNVFERVTDPNGVVTAAPVILRPFVLRPPSLLHFHIHRSRRKGEGTNLTISISLLLENPTTIERESLATSSNNHLPLQYVAVSSTGGYGKK
ncbi:unnamed protein product [Arabis nemorensis]|uniref:Uncharacterized protein n=1 Tax=Arabis nemorensis TaxID=586526 RepID=A0A565BA96_9BRAS|nr:unnamed protein product [Arabis nemorensis]